MPFRPAGPIVRLEQGSRLTDSGCWEWLRGKARRGYGEITWKGRLWPAHRLSYFLIKGDLTPELDLHHTCGNVACINPEHLMPITHVEHMRLGLATSGKGLETCSKCGASEWRERKGKRPGKVTRYCLNCARRRWTS